MKKATISTNELRFEFEKVLKAAKSGRELILTYRRKPLARIVPFREDEQEIRSDDPLFGLVDIAEAMGPIEPEELDEIIYKA